MDQWSRNIVVIDSTLEDTQTVVDSLRVHGFQVEHWRGGDAWRQRLMDADPDLVMLNADRGGMGLALAEQLRADPQLQRIPLVFLTHHDESDTKIRALEAGALDYVSMPFRAEELIDRVCVAMARPNASGAQMVTVDALTGLPNRQAFRDRLLAAHARCAAESNDRFAVMFIDLDRFKLINDGLGHEVGDQVIRSVSQRLGGAVRTQPSETRPGNDVVARLGSDEFAILLDGLDSAQDALSVAERLLSDLAKPIRVNGLEFMVTCSVGIRYCDGPMHDVELLLGDSDLALLEAKKQGKARCAVFNDEMRDHAVDRLQIECDLHRAVVEEQFIDLYQPYVDLESGSLAGFEALIRWHHPERGMIGPDRFIPIAEESGLILELGEWMLRAAMRQQRQWQQQLPGLPITVGVNLSKKQIDSADLLRRVDQILDELGPPERIKLEVTESTIMHDKQRVMRVIKALRQRGFTIAMDDFGTGESSLASLHEFPIDVLKIDRAFVQNLEDRRGYLAVINAIVTLAHNLNLRVVAEGIENHDQLLQLQAVECDIGQGYLFSKPVPAEQATQLLYQESLKRVGDGRRSA